MCANLELYEKLRAVPTEAKRTIDAGRLKGKTDINPMWRIKKLTETFGVCGVGWRTEIKRMWLESGANGEASAFVHIHLYVKELEGQKWSEPIEGIGGAAFIAKEKNGLYTDDDCYKKAYTDAISVACKSLGMAAEVYYEKDPDSKYSKEPPPTGPAVPFPEVELTYETALSHILMSGTHRGKTVAIAFKTDVKYFYPVMENLQKRDIDAINIVKAVIAKK